MTRLLDALGGLLDRLHTAAVTRTDWLTGDPARTDPDQETS